MKLSNFSKLFLSLLILFIFVSCKNQSTVKEYYDDGSLKYEFQTLNNEPHGFAKYYYPNGKPKDDSFYEHGKLTGKSLEYFENGDLHKESNFLDGKQHGWEFTYNKNKSLNAKVNWDNGKAIFTLSFNEHGDTLSYAVNQKSITYYKPGKVFQIICGQGTSNFKSIRFDVDGKIIKYNGPLTCLTKRDSTLLFVQNPNWISETQSEQYQ